MKMPNVNATKLLSSPATAHCAGIIGSKTYGVAKAVTIESIKVLESTLTSTWSDVLPALDLIVEVAKSNPLKKYVVSMSLGGDYFETGHDYVQRVLEAGVVVVASAGNENTDACTKT